MTNLKQSLSVRWLTAHFLVLVAVGFFITLGLWQLRRANHKATDNSLIKTRLKQSPLQFEKIKEVYDLSVPKEDPDSATYRQVKVAGTYDIAQEVLIRNRSYNGQPGYHLLTPLKVSDSRALLIERGWIPTNANDPPIMTAAPPKGEVELVGVLLPAQSQPKGFIGAKDPPSGKLTKVFWVDIKRLQAQMSYRLEPIYLRLISQNPPQSNLPLVAPLPSINSGSHLSYAIQWFAFAIILLIIYTLKVISFLTSKD